MNSTCVVVPVCRVIPEEEEGYAIRNLRKLVESFDTLEDPTLSLKRSSMKRGA
jgi:hypothetical protein